MSVTCKTGPLFEGSQKTYVNLTSFQLDDNILDDLSSVLSRQTFSTGKKVSTILNQWFLLADGGTYTLQ